MLSTRVSWWPARARKFICSSQSRELAVISISLGCRRAAKAQRGQPTCPVPHSARRPQTVFSQLAPGAPPARLGPDVAPSRGLDFAQD